MQNKTLRTLVMVMVFVLIAPLAAEALATALRRSSRGPADRPRVVPARTEGAERHLSLRAYRGLGAWIDIYNGGNGGPAGSEVLACTSPGASSSSGGERDAGRCPST